MEHAANKIYKNDFFRTNPFAYPKFYLSITKRNIVIKFMKTSFEDHTGNISFRVLHIALSLLPRLPVSP